MADAKCYEKYQKRFKCCMKWQNGQKTKKIIYLTIKEPWYSPNH